MMPSGEYYIGDLCYVMHDRWNEVCALLYKSRKKSEGEFVLKDGTRIACYDTVYGDGIYGDNIDANNEYWVDSGTLGCILISDIDIKCPDNIICKVGKGSNIVTIHNYFKTYKNNGKINFGPVCINTNQAFGEENI